MILVHRQATARSRQERSRLGRCSLPHRGVPTELRSGLIGVGPQADPANADASTACLSGTASRCPRPWLFDDAFRTAFDHGQRAEARRGLPEAVAGGGLAGPQATVGQR